MTNTLNIGFPGGSDGKASACNEGDLGSIPGSGRSPGEGNGNPVQYSCLENLMDRGAWWATVHGSQRVGHDWTTSLSLFTLYRSYGSAVKNPPAVQETSFIPWFRKIPWRRKWQLTPVFLPGKSHGEQSLAGYRPWVYKESDTTEWLKNNKQQLGKFERISWDQIWERQVHKV